MTDKTPFQAKTLDELRLLAEERGIPAAKHMRKKDLVPLLGRLEELESRAQSELRDRAREWQVPGIGGMKKRELASLLLQAERLRGKSLDELRGSARELGLEGIAKEKKAELIQRILKAQIKTRPEKAPTPAPAPAAPARERAAGLAWRRWLGVAIRLAGGLGALLSLIAMILLPLNTTRAIDGIDTWIATTRDGMGSASQVIREVSLSLDQASEVFTATRATLESVAGSLEDSGPLFESLEVLIGEQTPATLTATHDALLAVEEGAATIDTVLRGLGRLEPLTGISYDPDQPLDESIAEVALVLEPLPEALILVSQDLAVATEDLDQVGTDLISVSDELDTVSESVNQLNSRLADLKDGLERTALDIEALSERVPGTLWTLVVLLEVFLLWVALGQLAVYFVGEQLPKPGNHDALSG
jgi:hypothetical protein